MGKISHDALIKSRSVMTAQRKRECELINAARTERDEERVRRSAEMAYANGDDGALRYTKISMTPEQQGQGFFERYTAKLDAHTDQRADTVRRVLIPHVYRLYMALWIDLEQLTACRWYRDMYESTGLVGNIKCTDYGREVFSQAGTRDMFTQWQIDCRDTINLVRSNMTGRYMAFFDAVVLDDVAPQKALRFACKRNGSEGALFRDMADELLSCYKDLKN